MRTKLVNRYYCDHCNKGSLTKPSMVTHEARCCRNPERVCGFCKEGKLTQMPVDQLIAELRGNGIDGLREFSSGCPACMLSAILQDRAQHPDEPVEWIEGFDYKAEVKAFWEHENEMRAAGILRA